MNITESGFSATRRLVLKGTGLVALIGLGAVSFSASPALAAANDKYPDRKDLVAIVTDETQRNPQTVMPPFGRNLVLTDDDINAIVDFLYTL